MCWASFCFLGVNETQLLSLESSQAGGRSHYQTGVVSLTALGCDGGEQVL